MKKYTIRINCPCFEDIEVEAADEGLAIQEAENLFNCSGGRGEFEEVLKTEKV